MNVTSPHHLTHTTITHTHTHTHTHSRYLADLFGSKHVGAIHGRTLTAWSAAALVGPGILANLRGMSHTQVGGERKRGRWHCIGRYEYAPSAFVPAELRSIW